MPGALTWDPDRNGGPQTTWRGQANADAPGVTAVPGDWVSDAVQNLMGPVTTTIGPLPPPTPLAGYNAGDFVLLDPCPYDGATASVTFIPFGTGTITLKRLSLAGGVYTQLASVSRVVTSTAPITFTADDLAALGPFSAGEFFGLHHTGSCAGRVGLAQPGLGIAFSGVVANQTSFTASLVSSAIRFSFNVSFTAAAGAQLVTAANFSKVLDHLGLPVLGGAVVFGDSLSTTGQGFVDELAALLPDRSITGQGVGGQQAGSVSVRTGLREADATVSGASIPASGSGVAVSAIVPDPFAASIGTDASFIASLHDVPGVLSKSGAVYTFTRSDTGGAVALTNPAKLRIRSTFVSNTTGAGAVLLRDLSKNFGVLRIGHNDVFNDVIRDNASYSRQAVKDFIRSQVDALGGPRKVVVCSITRGFAWLTAARVAGYGLSGSITGWAADDAETVEACIEAQALNQWMADTFPGFVDLMAAYEASSAAYITSIDFGSGNVFKFGNATLLPDGAHGTSAVEQTIAANAVRSRLIDLGL